jgi:hypothetical protein
MSPIGSSLSPSRTSFYRSLSTSYCTQPRTPNPELLKPKPTPHTPHPDPNQETLKARALNPSLQPLLTHHRSKAGEASRPSPRRRLRSSSAHSPSTPRASSCSSRTSRRSRTRLSLTSCSISGKPSCPSIHPSSPYGEDTFSTRRRTSSHFRWVLPAEPISQRSSRSDNGAIELQPRERP